MVDIMDRPDLERTYSLPEIAPAEALPVAGGMMQIATGVITARRVEVPRNEGRILQRLRILAQAAGEDWYYRWNVKNRKTGKTDVVEGPSVKCALAVARMFGNCDVFCGAEDHGQHWLFGARFVDIETGFQLTRPFQQRKGQQTFRGDDEGRALDMAFQIGASKAIRNVITNALETFTTYAWENAKQSLIEEIGRKLDHYRGRVLQRLEDRDIDRKRVERVIGRQAAQWLAPDVARIIAELQSIGDGMASADDLFPPEEAEASDGAASTLDRVAAGAGKAAAGTTADKPAEEREKPRRGRPPKPREAAPDQPPDPATQGPGSETPSPEPGPSPSPPPPPAAAKPKTGRAVMYPVKGRPVEYVLPIGAADMVRDLEEELREAAAGGADLFDRLAEANAEAIQALADHGWPDLAERCRTIIKTLRP